MRSNDRQNKFKKGIDKATEERRRQRMHHLFGSRDRRRLLNKRRQLRGSTTAGADVKISQEVSQPWDEEAVLQKIQQAVQAFREASKDEIKCNSLRVLTEELSRKDCDPHPIIEKVIKDGVVKELIQLVAGATKNPDLVMQAMWCLTNVASGTHSQTEHVLPACPMFVQILSGTNAKLKEHAVWAIGNIAADCDDMRHALVRMGAFVPLSKIMQSKNTTLIKTTAWAVSNILRGRNPDREAFYKLPFMKSFFELLEQKDSGIVAEVCWCLTYLTSRDEQGCGQIIKQGFHNRVCAHLAANDNGIQPPVGLLIPALRTLGNMLAYNDEFNEKVLSTLDQKKFLGTLALCAKHEHRGLRKESIWVVGNILAGPPKHVDVVVKAGWLPPLLDVVKRSQFDIQREAVYALMNASRQPSVQSMLVKHGIIPPLLTLMKIDDVDTIKNCMTFLEKILDAKKDNVRLVEEAGGIEALETVQNHPNGFLWDHARAIIDKHWGEDVDDLEDNPSNAFGSESNIEYPAWRFGAHQS
mmetsp:Transcript_7283/g.17752  ORF Transcript_7283/g.17752 Transcript_7283/m.17752 type:complete len:526 (-) Transcript_7283:215-1792(-)